MQRYSRDTLAACGNVTATELKASGNRTSTRWIQYVWTPTARIAGQLPPNFALKMLAAVGADGLRNFRNAGGKEGVESHIFHSFAAGVAILDGLRSFSHEQRIKYRAPFFIYQYVQKMQAHLQCNFQSKPQLVIKRGSRNGGTDRNVLSPDFGYSSSGRGPRWSIDRLLVEGASAAQAAGIAKPKTAEQIAYGFLTAARRNPLRRSARELRRDVRRALFDAEDLVVKPRRRLITIVRDRLYRLLDAHLEDSQEYFDTWFFPAGGRNLPRAIGRQPNRPGGELLKEDVTATLLHLAWDAYGQLSECMGVWGQAFLASIPQPLSRKERELFDLTMMPHRNFGGLPRFLLMERMKFLELAWMHLQITPRDRELVGALHRLLVWYPEMVHKRREADRLNKRRTAQNGRGRQLTGH